MQSRGATEGILDGANTDALSNLHKDAQKGVSEAARKDALEVPFELHLWLQLLMQSLMHKCLQNGSYNCGPEAVLERILDGRLNVGLECAP